MVSLRGFVERYIVADDPCPVYSRLDQLDGLGAADSPVQGVESASVASISPNVSALSPAGVA